MKIKRILFTAVLFLITATSYAQSDDGKTMGPILKDALTYIETVESKGFEIVRIEFDILQSEKQTFRTLSQGWTYDIYAFGDYRLSDIDIFVYKQTDDGDWVQITSSSHDGSANSSTALVTIKPIITGSYKIVIKANTFNAGYTSGHYGLIVFHE